MKIESHKLTLNQSCNMTRMYIKLLKLIMFSKHRLFIDLVGFSMSLRDI